jgi:hypothetical protein
MMIERQEWEMCEEKEGEEGRGMSKNDVLDHPYKLLGIF